jgi:hypothetical protein
MEAAHGQDRGKPAIRDGAAQKASVTDTRSRFRKFIDAIKGKETSHSSHKDWTTGRDDGISKPWLKR